MLMSHVDVNCDIVFATDTAAEVDVAIATGKVFSDVDVNCVDVYAVDAAANVASGIVFETVIKSMMSSLQMPLPSKLM